MREGGPRYTKLGNAKQCRVRYRVSDFRALDCTNIVTFFERTAPITDWRLFFFFPSIDWSCMCDGTLRRVAKRTFQEATNASRRQTQNAKHPIGDNRAACSRVGVSSARCSAGITSACPAPSTRQRRLRAINCRCRRNSGARPIGGPRTFSAIICHRSFCHRQSERGDGARSGFPVAHPVCASSSASTSSSRRSPSGWPRGSRRSKACGW